MSKSFFYNHNIEEKNGTIIIDSIETTFGSINEAKDWLRKNYEVETLRQEINEDEANTISDKVLKVLQESGIQNISNKLIDSFIEDVSKKTFTLNENTLEIRTLYENNDSNRIDFKLKDDSTVVVSMETLELLNKYISEEQEIIDYMQENRENFLYVLENL